jgi:hypothetical protein
MSPFCKKTTPNCMSALQRLYDDDPFTSVWVDAICIHQDDLGERNHQVGVMGKIYAAANKVQIDLGHGDQGTEEAFRYVNMEYSMLESTGSPLQHFSYLDHAPQSIQKSITEILQHPWFTRIWVSII